MTNEAYLSEMANGKRPISDDDSRAIETKLKLPLGWMDRRNESLLALSELQFALCSLVVALPENKAQALWVILGEPLHPTPGA